MKKKSGGLSSAHKMKLKVRGAIHRNIEDIMAARVAHYDGNKLHIIKPPKNYR
jgi:hypothetical protein